MEKSEFVELYHKNFEEIKLDLNSYSRLDCLIAMIGGKPKKHDKKPVISPPTERIQSISKYELPPRSWYGLELFEESKTEELQIQIDNLKIDPNIEEETRKKRQQKTSDQARSNKKHKQDTEVNDKMVAKVLLPVPEESTLPTEYMNALTEFAGGKTIGDLKLLLKKKICQTDISKHHNRLSLPKDDKNPITFLKEEEISYLRSRKDDKRASMNSMIVDVIPPSLEPAEVDLREWTMSNGILVLTKSWYKLVVSNSIEAGETFEVWVVRIGVEEKLCFLLVRV